MTPKRYKELIEDNEITFLRDDIEEDFNSHPEVTKTSVKYNLIFHKIEEEDTLLTIYNFISTNELKFKIEPHEFIDKTTGIKITVW